MSNKCSAIYPVSGLTVNITVTNNTTNIVDFSGVATEAGNTGVYNYIYTPTPNVDYTWVATTPGYSDVKGVNFADGTSTGGVSVGDIWNADIATFSNVPGSFGAKFSTYGGVSHVINNTFDEETKKELKKLIEEVTTPIVDYKEILNAISSIPKQQDVDLTPLLKAIPTQEDIANAVDIAIDNREKKRILNEIIDKEFYRFMSSIDFNNK